MAWNEALAPIFRWAFWWMSDDIFSGLENSYFSSYNTNVRDNSKAITLNKALILDTDDVVTETINEIIKLSTGAILAFGGSGWIYRKQTTTREKVTTSTPTTAILSWREFNGYVYWTTISGLHRILTSNVATWASEVVNRKALEGASYHPLLVSMGSMYVGNKNKLSEVNIANVFDDVYTVENNGIVKKINDLWWHLRITTISQDGNNNVYLWSRGIWKANPNQTIPLIGYNIRQSIIHNGYNFLVTNKWLWILDWYNTITLKKNKDFNDNINSIAVFDEKLLIWGTWWVYVYGAKDKNYPQVLSLEHRSSNWQSDDVIGAMFSDGTDLYVSWSNGTSYGIDKLSSTVYYTEWELITRWYYANSLYSIKRWLNIRTGFKPVLEWQSIKISYSIDWWDYEELIAIEYDTNIKRTFTEDVFTPWEFQYIQFKIELTWDGTSTPEFYCLDLFFDNDIKR